MWREPKIPTGTFITKIMLLQVPLALEDLLIQLLLCYINVPYYINRGLKKIKVCPLGRLL